MWTFRAAVFSYPQDAEAKVPAFFKVGASPGEKIVDAHFGHCLWPLFALYFRRSVR